MSVLLSVLREVHDPREINARHDLAELLFLALSATLCGAKSCVDIADFADGREEDLREIVALKHGAPSHDTFSRVFRLLDPEELQQAFAAFMTALRRELGLSTRPKGVVAVDGKALRRGYDKGRAFMPPLMVSVWDAETRLAVAAKRAPGGDEVKTTLDLLKSLDLKGCTVTADALHCRPDTARALTGQKAHYAFALKANRGRLFAAAERSFAEADGLSFFETREQAHGRLETRRVSVLPLKKLKDPPAFPGLRAIGRIEASRTVNGKSATAVRYVALSRQLTPQRLAETVRAHWTIENQLHWSLDVVFHEDDARTRKNNGPQNLAIIRRLAKNILQAHPLDLPISRKMRRANWSKDFFFELFTHMQ
jgi:predicted transposase YbfD/YdcC